MSTSPERLVGEIMKDIDKDSNPDEQEYGISKDETAYQSSNDKVYSSSMDSQFSQNYPTLFFPFFSFQKKNEEEKNIFSYNNISSALEDQNKTKQLQSILIHSSEETVSYIISELSGKFVNIFKDKNGNYFCSDLILACNYEQRKQILTEISPVISEICLDEFGTHPVQKLIECSSSTQEYKLLLESFKEENKIIMASLTKNGAFVIQKIIVKIPDTMRTEFNNIIIKNVFTLSKDMYGVCVLKKFVGYSNNEMNLKLILNHVLKNFVNIATNKYGNYLIQDMLENFWKTHIGTLLKKIIINKYSSLAKHKYSSYVCDAFIKLGGEDKKLSKIINNLKNNMDKNKNINNIATYPININNKTKEPSE